MGLTNRTHIKANVLFNLKVKRTICIYIYIPHQGANVLFNLKVKRTICIYIYIPHQGGNVFFSITLQFATQISMTATQFRKFKH